MPHHIQVFLANHFLRSKIGYKSGRNNRSYAIRNGNKHYGERVAERVFDVGIAEQHAVTFAAPRRWRDETILCDLFTFCNAP